MPNSNPIVSFHYKRIRIHQENQKSLLELAEEILEEMEKTTDERKREELKLFFRDVQGVSTAEHIKVNALLKKYRIHQIK